MINNINIQYPDSTNLKYRSLIYYALCLMYNMLPQAAQALIFPTYAPIIHRLSIIHTYLCVCVWRFQVCLLVLVSIPQFARLGPYTLRLCSAHPIILMMLMSQSLYVSFERSRWLSCDFKYLYFRVGPVLQVECSVAKKWRHCTASTGGTMCKSSLTQLPTWFLIIVVMSS